jgi:hypothetical protein
MHLAGWIGPGQAFGRGERVQSADGHHGPPRRAGGQREMIVIPLAQPGQEGRDILRGHLTDDRPAPRGQRLGVTEQVAPVSLQGVRGQAPLDREVIEITLDGFRQGGQLSTSLTGVDGRPCAFATGWQVRVPSWVCSPRVSAGSALSAPRQPRLASSTTYGSVTLVSA